MIRLICTLLTISSLNSFAQSDSLQRIPGSRIQMVPPKNFTLSKSFSGFQNEESGSSIVVLELKAPFKDVAKGFTESKGKKIPFDIVSIDTLLFQNKEALWLVLKQEAYGNIYLKNTLAFGNDSLSIIIQGIFPETSKALDLPIKKSVLTAVYDESAPSDPFETIQFTMNAEPFGFVLKNVFSGVLTYDLPDSRVQNKREYATLVAAGSMGRVPISNAREYALNRFKKLPGQENYSVDTVREINIDDLPGYEIIGRSPDKKVLSYNIMLYPVGGGYFMIAGHAWHNHNELLELYRKAVQTFRRK